MIMQIGNKELDSVYYNAIEPAILSTGLSVKRVDKHNQGGLLKSEIIKFIQESEIIIADLTNERPNCYLEIGYAMGIDKFRNLILTVKDDHFQDHPNYMKGGPKIHFDLSGYDILAWSPNSLDSFKEKLIKRIKHRLFIISPQEQELIWDNAWIQKHRGIAQDGLLKAGFEGSMEIRFALDPPKINVTQNDLYNAARSSEIHTFGWPIGVFLYNIPEEKPYPTNEGIVAEIQTESYDYWTINKKGDFYSLISLFEDQRNKSEYVFYDIRIFRVTESLLYCAKLYNHFDVGPFKNVYFAIRHSGFMGRVIIPSDPSTLVRKVHKSIENNSETSIVFRLDQIESNLVILVKDICTPFFELFDFFQVDHAYYENIIDRFVSGRI